MQKVFGNNSSESRLFQSRLHDVLLDEQQKRREDEEQKRKFKKIQTEKKLQYAEIVRNNYKPKIKKPTSPLNDSKKQENENKRAMSLLETQKQGNEYMKAVHKNVSLVKVNTTVFSQDQTPFKYKDYLK